MTFTTPPRHRRRRSKRWWVLTSVLLVVGVGCFAVGLRGHQVSLGLPHQSEHPASPAAASAITAPPLKVVAQSTPVVLSIPAIHVVVAVSELGLNPDGTVQVPTDFQEPGWYRLGPSPGQEGSAVILGHVDSYQGPAVFFNLRSLTAGDLVDVTLADGVVAHFVVTAVAMYPKDQFPAQQVYGSHGHSQLQLVTCGGTFDSQTGHYLSNVVVYSSLVKTTPTTPRPHL